MALKSMDFEGEEVDDCDNCRDYAGSPKPDVLWLPGDLLGHITCFFPGCESVWKNLDYYLDHVRVNHRIKN